MLFVRKYSICLCSLVCIDNYYLFYFDLLNNIDLKCIREMHILDSWYHLNRTDQIIGRAIRYCSHTALRAVEERQGLPLMALNNCLIYLHVCHIPETVRVRIGDRSIRMVKS